MSDRLRIATRGSQLALWQAEHVRALLIAREPALTVELVVLKTEGDRVTDRPLAAIGGKGLFVKEIEEALLDGRADLAVHSMKDLPADLLPTLVLCAVPAREDPRDALLVGNNLSARTLAELPAGAHIGTSSVRRSCQLHHARPDLRISMLRGNVDTRLRKLDAGEYDAILLACAGLRRLGHSARITEAISTEVSLPAIGQGALALECRADDRATRSRLAPLHDHATGVCTSAERRFLSAMGGSCTTPLGAHATLAGDTVTMDAMVGALDGSVILRRRQTAAVENAVALGDGLADELLRAGAQKLLGR